METKIANPEATNLTTANPDGKESESEEHFSNQKCPARPASVGMETKITNPEATNLTAANPDGKESESAEHFSNQKCPARPASVGMETKIANPKAPNLTAINPDGKESESTEHFSDQKCPARPASVGMETKIANPKAPNLTATNPDGKESESTEHFSDQKCPARPASVGMETKIANPEATNLPAATPDGKETERAEHFSNQKCPARPASVGMETKIKSPEATNLTTASPTGKETEREEHFSNQKCPARPASVGMETTIAEELPVLLATIEEALDITRAWDVIDACLDALVDLGRPIAITTLTRLMAHSDSQMRFRAVERLARLGNAEPQLRVLAQARDSAVRVAAVWGLVCLHIDAPVLRYLQSHGRLLIPRLVNLGARGVRLLCECDHEWLGGELDYAARLLSTKLQHHILIEELADAGSTLAKLAFERIRKRPRKDRWAWHKSIAPLRREYLDDVADDDEQEGE